MRRPTGSFSSSPTSIWPSTWWGPSRTRRQRPDAIRFCVIGPVERHIEKLNALRGLGVDQFAVYDMHDAQEEVIDAYGQKVIPAVGS